MTPEEKNMPVVLSVCGKGGVGKTSISAMLTLIFTQIPGCRVLAIDADPAVGLSTALGVDVGKTLDDIRTGIVDEIKTGNKTGKEELLARIDYEMLEALQEDREFGFLAVGRPETDGCYCRLNSFLKEILKELCQNFHVVIIDGEAGIEQVNRRVMESVTHLVLVSDTSVKGLNVADSILEVAGRTIRYKKAGLVLNRVKDMKEVDEITNRTSIPVLGTILEDDAIYRFDRMGKSLFELSDNPALEALKKAVQGFEIPVLKG